MAKKPCASDWVKVETGVEYSAYLDLYWYKGQVYDDRSARHNGIIGMGATLKENIKKANDIDREDGT